jgi:hypothetical protein
MPVSKSQRKFKSVIYKDKAKGKKQSAVQKRMDRPHIVDTKAAGYEKIHNLLARFKV